MSGHGLEYSNYGENNLKFKETFLDDWIQAHPAQDIINHCRVFLSYETSDGVSRQESAVVNGFGSDTEELVVRGSYSFTADDGQVYTINFVADKNGFQPTGDHIPVA